MARPKKILKKVFISWSGDNSKEIAKSLKDVLENVIFEGKDLKCFVSDVDISSGDDWWDKIKTELKSCSLGIACITKENLMAPWIYFESGAMISHDLKLIPLLISCDIKSLNETPLSKKHMVDFYDQDKFIGMITQINKDLQICDITDKQLKAIASEAYTDLVKTLNPTLKKLKDMRIFNAKFTYPPSINTVDLNTVYISAPMSSITEDEYNQLREFVIQLKSKLEALGFSKVLSPLLKNKDYAHFDGHKKAIIDNFKKLKSVESIIVLYPKKLPSSILVEMGYGLALCKKMLIFYREELPYILEDADRVVSRIYSKQFESFDDILNIIESNGKQLFEMDEEE